MKAQALPLPVPVRLSPEPQLAAAVSRDFKLTIFGFIFGFFSKLVLSCHWSVKSASVKKIDSPVMRFLNGNFFLIVDVIKPRIG